MGIADCALWGTYWATRLGSRSTNSWVARAIRSEPMPVPSPTWVVPKCMPNHAIACKKKGYKAYKVHAYICWNPHTEQPAPQLPGFPKEDVEVCKAVRDAVGDDMVLMLDPFGVYTLDEAIWVGRELEKLDYYWLEHPMIETRVEAYKATHPRGGYRHLFPGTRPRRRV